MKIKEWLGCKILALENLIKKGFYELTNIRDIVSRVQGSAYFTVLDLKEGFYHIEIEEQDKMKQHLSQILKCTNRTL